MKSDNERYVIKRTVTNDADPSEKFVSYIMMPDSALKNHRLVLDPSFASFFKTKKLASSWMKSLIPYVKSRAKLSLVSEKELRGQFASKKFGF